MAGAGASSTHLGDEPIDDRLSDISARSARPVRRTDDEIDELHGREAARSVRIEDHVIVEIEPAVLDRSALTIDDQELVRALVDDESAHKLVAAKLVAPGARHAADVRLDAGEQTQVLLAEAHALGIRQHDVLGVAVSAAAVGKDERYASSSRCRSCLRLLARSSNDAPSIVSEPVHSITAAV